MTWPDFGFERILSFCSQNRLFSFTLFHQVALSKILFNWPSVLAIFKWGEKLKMCPVTMQMAALELSRRVPHAGTKSAN